MTEGLSQARPFRLMWGGVITVTFMSFVLFWISARYMQVAAKMLDEKVAWPQINFMSAYPDDVRNGYLLFVLAVCTTVFLSSGLIGGLVGASVGKRALGITYHAGDAGPAGYGRMFFRALLICLVLSPTLLLGPVLGFVFGEAADPFSMLALGVGIILAIAALFPLPRQTLSWVNRRAGLVPVERNVSDKGAS